MVDPRGKEGENGLDVTVTNTGVQDQPPGVDNGNPLDHRELAGLNLKC
jgi:hypothetical protein